MQASPKRPNSRELILDAAEALVLDAGAAHLTLDAVAERAGISKGGLLYNYATKEALLQAMVARHVEQVTRSQDETLAHLPPGAGCELKACLLTALDSKRCIENRRLSVSIIAASANEPRLLEPIRELQRRRLDHLLAANAAGLDFERAAVVCLAVDGLMLTEMFQTSPYDAAQRERIVAQIVRMIDEETSNCSPFHPDRAEPATTC